MESRRPKDLLKQVAELLGAEGVVPRPADLRKRTREQLLEAARKLALRGVAKLPKEQLAGRVSKALEAFGRGEAPTAAAKEEKRAGRPAAARSRSGRRRAAPAAASEGGEAAGGVPASEAVAPDSAAAEAVAAATERERAQAAKLDLGPAAREEAPVEHVPWSYGVDRVTAAAVDPDKLYVYWEVTDEAMEQARAGLGRGGATAWLNLRVYDTSGRIFDGTNAHSYLDHRVERSDRQWFFTVGKPTSTAFVEIGMKSTEGFFAKVARSGRVDFPRSEPAPPGEPEWMTVLSATGEAHRAAAGSPPGTGRAPPPPPVPPEHLPAAGPEDRGRPWPEGSWERVESSLLAGESGFELQRRFEWQGPLTVSTWEEGLFPYPVHIEPPQREEWQGSTAGYRLGELTYVVHGPWEVVIRSFGARGEASVVGRWEVYRSWLAEGGHLVREAAWSGSERLTRMGASEWAAGASERVSAAGSEVRLGGASEMWPRGASEMRYRGASERLYGGASERLRRGASERRLGGASEARRGGASERVLGGASERVLGGASERRPGGGERQEGKPEAAPPGSPAAGDYPGLE